MTDMPSKLIHYRGGVVRFEVPAHWREEYGAEGGGAFWDDAIPTRTFRLELLTLGVPLWLRFSKAPHVKALEMQSKAAAPEHLPTGNALVSYDQAAVEQEHRLRIRFWLVGNHVPPKTVRIASFSYTMLESDATSEAVQAELEMLERSVRSAEFATQVGSTGG